MRKINPFPAFKLDPYLLLLIALSLFALTPLLAPGYFYEAHDGRHSVFYLIMFDASIRDGAWWPRWAMHHIQGYGYPTFIIQAPLGFYVAEIFVLLGAGYTLAAKLAWATGFLVGGWGMYQLVVHWLTPYRLAPDGKASERTTRLDIVRLAGVAAGLLYVFIPYHLVDIYVRAALNDSLLLAWFPWVFLTFDRLIEQGSLAGWQQRLALAMLCLAGVLLTHTFALVSFAPLLVTFVLFRLALSWRQRTGQLLGRIGLAGAAGIGALLLFACFLLPLLGEGQYLKQQVYTSNTYDFRNNFVYLGQFLSPFWGYGYSDDPKGANDGMGFQVGVIALLLGSVAIYELNKKPGRQAVMLYLLGATVALLWLMTPAAQSLWEIATPLAVIQFPWRLLSLTAFTLSALAGLAVWNLLPTLLNKAEDAGGLLIMGLLIMFASSSYINAQLQPIEPWREDGRAIFRFEREHPDMIAPTQWVKQTFTESPMSKDYAADTYHEDYSDHGLLERLSILKGAGKVLSNYSRGSSGGGVIQLEQPAVVRINEFYFPGWQVWIDGRLTPYRISDPYGLIEVDVPAGEHHIDARMGSTPIRQVGAAISWATLLVAIGLLAWPLRSTLVGAYRRRRSTAQPMPGRDH
ncbi:6-pyruvoyl-tetrahydropterin synthase-related protein [soil metagenome]